MKKWISNFYYSFPIRLFLDNFKGGLLLLSAWAILLFLIIGQIGSQYGIPYLFLDPEYLGVVGYFSFQLVGVCFGVFFFIWNISTYLIRDHKYPFIASMKWPVAMFTLNNALLPFIFISIYIWQVIQFQSIEMLKTPIQIAWMILGLLAGFFLTIFVISLYFLLTNKNIFGYIKDEKQSFKSESDVWYDLASTEKISAARVDYYLTRRLRFRPIRDVAHYDEKLIRQVFRQHHINAFILAVLTSATLIGLGFLIDIPLFEIPAAGSMFLFFGMFVSVASFLYFWAGEWGSTAFVVFLFVVNYVTTFDFFNYDNHAYGVNYEAEKAIYSLENLDSLSTEQNIAHDKAITLQILENWKQKNTEGKPYWYKPKMVMVVSSGGGSRAATFTMKVLQTADSLSQGGFMQSTMLMSGASGGMLGIGYYRELYLRNQLGVCKDLYSEKYQRNIAKDLLNKLTTAVVTNDIYYPMQKRAINSYDYILDRGMMMEYALNENTENVLDKPLSDYRSFEKNASIPMLITAGTNIADSRKLLISPQPISYLMKGSSPDNKRLHYEIDAIDYGALFSKNSPYNIRFSSVLRMNATYPMILPNVSLPSQPKIDIVDAGLRDNYGIEVAMRFTNVFHEWINENTSGVVIVQIRGSQKDNEIEDFEYSSFFSKLFGAFGNLYGNLTVSQDYLQDYMIDGANDVLNDNLEIIRFDLRDAESSMSMHLTKHEFDIIVQAADAPNNQESFNRLMEILEE